MFRLRGILLTSALTDHALVLILFGKGLEYCLFAALSPKHLLSRAKEWNQRDTFIVHYVGKKREVVVRKPEALTANMSPVIEQMTNRLVKY